MFIFSLWFPLLLKVGEILHSDENKLEVKLMEDFFIGVVLEFQKQCTVQLLRYRA